jgi:hypothetical protein
MTKEQILAAIAQAAKNGLVFDVDAAYITKVRESNAGGYVTFWVGTQAQYNAIKDKDTNCMYIVTDSTKDADLVAAIKAHVLDYENPHKVTAVQAGARPDTWLPTPEEIGAAPTGFGLGGGVIEADWNSVDYYTKSGWYAISNLEHIGGTSVRYAVMRVDGDENSFVVQTLWVYNSEDGTRYQLQRHITGGGYAGWFDWEWENPPLELGCEYGTTERYDGRRVYVRRIQFPKIMSPTYTESVDISDSGMERLLECKGYAMPEYVTTVCKDLIMLTDELESERVYIRVSANAASVQALDCQGYTPECVIKYTANK